MDEAATIQTPTLYLPPVTVWAAAQSNARSEKVVARELERQEATVYLPLHKKRRMYGNRVRESWLPLFPGYVFYDYASIDRRQVFDTHRVCNVLVPDEPAGLREDLEQIAKALHVEPELERCDDIPPGTPVRVVQGPFTGFEGTMVRRGRRMRLIILVHFIDSGVEVTMDASFVEPRE